MAGNARPTKLGRRIMRSHDDILDNAISAMRDGDMPAPSVELIVRTRRAMRDAETAAAPPRQMSFRWAAIVVLATSAAALTWVFAHHGRAPSMAHQSPSNQPVVAPVALQSPY